VKRALVLAAVGEAATGLALLVVPSIVGKLLLGEELTGVAVPVARVAGIALIGLGVACWPGTPILGMLTYGAAVAVYLAYLGLAGGLGGILLWPAVALHVVLAILLVLPDHILDGPRGASLRSIVRRQSGHVPSRRSRTCCNCRRTSGRVQRALLRGGKRSAEREESVRDSA